MSANPYRLWSDIDPALPSHPIHVLGPPMATPTGRAPLAVLLTGGCHRVLPPSAEQSQCESVRDDDVYEEVPEGPAAQVREHQTNPTQLGLLTLRELAQVGAGLALSPIDGVAPGPEGVRAGAYPATRALPLLAGERGGSRDP